LLAAKQIDFGKKRRILRGILFEKMSCFLMKWQVCGKYFPDEFL
jgi:hypothetical protein